MLSFAPYFYGAKMQLKLLAFNKARILTIDDITLDGYWSGATSCISPEVHAPVVHVQEIEPRPRGAGNVAPSITTSFLSAGILEQAKSFGGRCNCHSK